MGVPALKTQVISPILGLDVSRPGEYLDVRSTSNCQNIEIKRGVIQQRQGGEALGASLAQRVMGMAELEVGVNTFLVRIGTTKAEVLDKSAGTWSSIANAPLTAVGSEVVSFAFPLISGDKYMVYTNSVDNIRKTAGTTDADLGGTPPKCRYVLDFGGYLLLAYVIDSGDTFGYRVQWSDTGDPEEWSTGNAGSVNLLEDSLDITGIHVFGDFVAVHKESAIYLGQLVSTSDVFLFSRKETGAGTIAHGSIQNLPTGEQIFLARDGIRIFNGVTASLIDSPITDELRDSMNPEFVHKATSVLVKDLDEYWVGIPIGSQEEPDTIYKYNYRTGQVYRDVRTGLTAMTLSKRTTNESWDSDGDAWDVDTTAWDSVTELALHKQVVFGDDDGDTTIRTTSANDSDIAINSFWDSKDFSIIDINPQRPIGTLVRWKQIELWAKGSGLTAYYSTDSGTTWTQISTVSLASDYQTDDAPTFLYFDKVSSKIRFRFRNANAGETWTLKQFWIGMSLREVRN